MTDPTGGAQSPQGESIPGPTYPHPDGMNDPADEQYGDEDRDQDEK